MQVSVWLLLTTSCLAACTPPQLYVWLLLTMLCLAIHISLLPAAIQVLEEKMGKDLTEAQIQELLWKFLDSRFITKNRPFYFHTADGNPRGLNGLFNWLKDNGKVSTLPIIFPERWASFLCVCVAAGQPPGQGRPVNLP
jgi:hypothetical protein